MSNINVNKEQWESLSIEDQEIIISTLRNAKLLDEADVILGDSEVEASAEYLESDRASTECTIACSAAMAAPSAACLALVIPSQVSVCLIAVGRAYDMCISYCDG